MSERSWQKSDRTLWRAKNTDTFKPMGPWIETDAKLEDENDRPLNGEETIRFKTNKMLFSVQTFQRVCRNTWNYSPATSSGWAQKAARLK